MPLAFYIAFGAVFTVAVSYSIGVLALNALKVRLYRGEEPVFAFLLGAALLHLEVFALCAAGLAYKGVFLASGLIVIALAARRRALRPQGEALPPLPRLWRWVFHLGFAAFALLYVVNAMAPEASSDGSNYHLGLVARYLRERGFVPVTTNMYASLPQGVELLYLHAFAFGRHSAAALVHCAFTLAAPWLIAGFGRRMGFPGAGAAAALFFFASPMVGVDGTTAYIDVAVACIVFAVFALAWIWVDERQAGLLPAVGLLAGYAFAAKYTVFMAVPYVLGLVGWKQWRSRGPVVKPLAIVAGCACLMMVPWLTKNWIYAGNPFSPFLNRFFPNDTVTAAFEQDYIRQMQRYGEPKSYWDLPLDITAYGDITAGMLGPLFALTPLALFGLRLRHGRRLLLAALLFALPYYANIGTRFLLPSLPFFSLALAVALHPGKDSGATSPASLALAVLTIAHLALSWPHVLRRYCSESAWTLRELPVAAALRLVDEDTYLSQKLGDYPIARFIEAVVPRTNRVFTYGGVPEAYCSREIIVAYQSKFGNRLQDMLWAGLWPQLNPYGRFRFDFPARKLRGVRLVQTAAPNPDTWSITELRLYRGKSELRRSNRWRVRAQPNPWAVQSAFDNSPVTRWRSAEPVRPGMFVEVDFQGEEELDAIVMEHARDQWKVTVKAEGRGSDGAWVLLADTPRNYDVPMIKGLKRGAIDELRARGIHYLLIRPNDPGASEIKSHYSAWGMAYVGERGAARLYKLLGSP